MFIVLDVGELLGAVVGPGVMVGAFDIEGLVDGAISGDRDGASDVVG